MQSSNDLERLIQEVLTELGSDADPKSVAERVRRLDLGLPAEDEFTAVCSWLGRAQLLHKLDQHQAPVRSREVYQIPDLLAQFENTGPLLIEVKSKAKPTLSFRPDYLNRLHAYAALVDMPLLIAWKHHGLWTLFEARHLNKAEKNFNISLSDALKENLLGVLAGDVAYKIAPGASVRFRCKKEELLATEKTGDAVTEQWQMRIASGVWFHVLPPEAVPPLVALSSVAAQLVGLIAVRKAFDWRRAWPFLAGGAAGVPIGVATLSAVSPLLLRTVIGVFLLAYAIIDLFGRSWLRVPSLKSRPADGCIGLGGGFLGGFAGLSGPLPLIWLQLTDHNATADAHRAIYQPFNLVILTLAGIGMAVAGQITADVLLIAALCLPATLLGSWIGARLYKRISANRFRHLVLALLLLSGTILIVQAFAG